jgi:H+-transporting ATPase
MTLSPVQGLSSEEAAIILQLAIGERLEAFIIAVLLIFNVALGVFQAGRAGEALAALKSKLALKAFVKRDGQWIEVPAATLVPGDVVRLALGCVVPANVRLFDGLVLIDQSMLTGESVAVEIGPGKTAYASALVRRGAATAEITATGLRTYFGKTAGLSWCCWSPMPTQLRCRSRCRLLLRWPRH